MTQWLGSEIDGAGQADPPHQMTMSYCLIGTSIRIAPIRRHLETLRALTIVVIALSATPMLPRIAFAS